MITSVYSVAGNVKKINQDSVLLKTASCKAEEIALLAVCDGMGGLENGEEASQLAALHLSRWFTTVFPYLVSEKDCKQFFIKLKNSLDVLINKADQEIKAINRKTGVQSGTTLTAVLIMGKTFYTVNIGDSRAYLMTEKRIEQLTKDQTYVQMLLDQGRLSKEEISRHPQRNALLQCIGAAPDLEPVYTRGYINGPAAFLVCSDGFRHLISDREMHKALRPSAVPNEYGMQEALARLTDLVMDRGEKDNISAVCLKMEDECWK